MIVGASTGGFLAIKAAETPDPDALPDSDEATILRAWPRWRDEARLPDVVLGERAREIAEAAMRVVDGPVARPTEEAGGSTGTPPQRSSHHLRPSAVIPSS